jgi:hypothetical protein
VRPRSAGIFPASFRNPTTQIVIPTEASPPFFFAFTSCERVGSRSGGTRLDRSPDTQTCYEENSLPKTFRAAQKRFTVPSAPTHKSAAVSVATFKPLRTKPSDNLLQDLHIDFIDR